MSLFFSFSFRFVSAARRYCHHSSATKSTLNHVECVVEGKPRGFELQRVKKTFPRICWAFWFFSMIAGYFAIVMFIQLFQERKKDFVVKGTLTSSLIVFYVGFLFSKLAIVYSTRTEGYKMLYPFIYLSSMGLSYILGYVYCRVSSI